MSRVTNPDRYLAAVVVEFEQDCQRLTGFELKQRLWKSAVVCFETMRDPDPYLEALENAAVGAGLRMTAVLSTFRSAYRRVNR